MMKIAMRPQKPQLQSLYKFTTPGASTFAKRDAAIMFGYTTLEVLVIGAAGGRSGMASVYAGATYGTNTEWGAGGGGGGCQKKRVVLDSVPSSVSVQVGALGSNGADTGVSGAYAGTGGAGGSSSFGTIASATGGSGGIGGFARSDASGRLSEGGAGGSGPGATGGVGGGPLVTQTNGNWVDDGNGGGSGGGGGGGHGCNTTNFGISDPPPQAGAAGVNGGTHYAGGEGVQGSYWGGGGGGANAGPITGVPSEDYGSGYNSGKGNGAVIVKLS